MKKLKYDKIYDLKDKFLKDGKVPRIKEIKIELDLTPSDTVVDVGDGYGTYPIDNKTYGNASSAIRHAEEYVTYMKAKGLSVTKYFRCRRYSGGFGNVIYLNSNTMELVSRELVLKECGEDYCNDNLTVLETRRICGGLSLFGHKFSEFIQSNYSGNLLATEFYALKLGDKLYSIRPQQIYYIGTRLSLSELNNDLSVKSKYRLVKNSLVDEYDNVIAHTAIPDDNMYIMHQYNDELAQLIQSKIVDNKISLDLIQINREMWTLPTVCYPLMQ